MVGYSAEEMGDEGTAGQQGGFIEQEIPTAGKLRLNRLTFGHEENQERWALAAQRMIVLNSIRIAFYQPTFPRWVEPGTAPSWECRLF